MERSSFENFIKAGLINTGNVTGVILLSHHGLVMYSYGSLKQLSKDEIGQFLQLFRALSTARMEQSCNTDFILTCCGNKAIYKVYQKTHSSVYATSSKGSGGLTVCNLPYGILVSVYSGETRAADAVKVIETFCDIMRR